MPKDNMVFGLECYNEVFVISPNRNLAPSSVSTRLEDFVGNYRHRAPLNPFYQSVEKRCGGSCSTSKAR